VLDRLEVVLVLENVLIAADVVNEKVPLLGKDVAVVVAALALGNSMVRSTNASRTVEVDVKDMKKAMAA